MDVNRRMTSRERVLAAMRRQPVDHVPCAPFMNFQPEDQRWGKRWQYPFGPSPREMLDYMLGELGVDQLLQTGMGYYPEPGVSSRVCMDGEIIHKTWTTPSGELHAAIRHDEHWLPGLDIPFFDDYNPAHFVEPWIKTLRDVDCLRHILQPPRDADALASMRFQFRECRRLAERYQVAFSMSAGLGLSGAVNMFGPSEIALRCMTDPELVDAYLEVDHQYNLGIMERGLDLGVDLIRRNGFYETCDLFSPALLQRFLGRRLKREADLVHAAGKVIGYTVLSGYGPMLDHLAAVGFDCLICPDVFLRGGDGRLLADKLGSHTSFWTGPSDTVHLPWERPEAVRQAVRQVFEVFGKTGLLITPCSSAKAVFPWENVLAMVDEWRTLR
jgi:hypothetical protein